MRAEGWELLLNEHISRAYRGGFSWGAQDCALWAADWVHKCTGEDLGKAWRGKYKNEHGAAKAMLKRGFGDVADIADAHLTPVRVTLARRGDIVLHAQGCLGICNGRHSFFLTESDVLMAETLGCVKAWAVG